MEAIAAGENYFTDVQYKDAIRNLMLASTDGGVIAMHEYIMADLPYYQYGFRQSLIMAMNPDYSNEELVHTVQEFLNFRTLISDYSIEPFNVLRIFSSLHSYQQLPKMDNYAVADEKTKRKVEALITVTMNLYKRYGWHSIQTVQAAHNAAGSWKDFFTENPAIPAPTEFGLPLELVPNIRLIDDDLINLVVSQPDHADDIARAIITEGISAGALLRDIFTSGTQSLRNGLL